MLAAILVHVLTALGGILGLCSIHALLQGHFHLAVLLNLATFIVDGIDGPLARKFKVKERLPWFDGSAIDMVIDFFNYCMWPAIFILATPLISSPYNIFAASAIVFSSIFWYGCDDQKADNWSFKRFPCLWNIVIIYLFLASAPLWISLSLIAFFAIMSFVPAYFPHGFRLEKVVKATWARVLMIILVSTSVGSGFLYVAFYPHLPDEMWQYSLVYCAIYLGLSVVLTIRAYKKD